MLGSENWGLVAIGGVASLVASILYMVGGTKMSFGGQLWLRRWLGSFILAGATNGIAGFLHVWTWQYLLIFLSLAGGFSLPYGADTTAEKVIKRLIFSLGVSMACVFGTWSVGFTASAFIVLGLSIFVGLTSIVMGALNPWKNAPLEQYLICQVLTMFVPFWGFVK